MCTCLAAAGVELWLEEYTYVVLAVLLLSSGLGAPIPEDIPLLIGGWLCRQGQAQALIMLFVAWTFVLAGDCVLYILGRYYGHHVPRLPGFRNLLTESRITRAEAFFARHGGKTVFAMRFLAGVRAATWFAAGALKIPFWKFIAYDGAAALVFVPAYLLLGWFFADQWGRVHRFAQWGQVALALGILAVVTVLMTWQILRHRRRPSASGDRTEDSGNRVV